MSDQTVEVWVGRWQPIKTAPKDGTRILGYGKLGFEKTSGIGTIAWDWSRWGSWTARRSCTPPDWRRWAGWQG